jgi:CDP-diacylglycerol pyrophosphatase
LGESRYTVRAASRLFTCCALTAAGLLSGWAAPPAMAAPAWPDPACGNPADTNIDLWNDVKDAKPLKKGHNVEVVWPKNDRNLGYAIHDGGEGAKDSKYNWLLIAAIRESGIECQNLLDSGAANYFQEARQKTSHMPLGTDWAIGINSVRGRTRAQLHIHISRLQLAARTDLNNAAKSIPTTDSKWGESVITVMGKKFRAWNAPNLERNIFAVLNDQVVKALSSQKVAMDDQTILVAANKKGTGVIVLDSDKVSKTTNPGVGNIEFLMNESPE